MMRSWHPLIVGRRVLTDDGRLGRVRQLVRRMGGAPGFEFVIESSNGKADIVTSHQVRFVYDD